MKDIFYLMAERPGEYGIHYFVVLEKDFVSMKPTLDMIENAKIYQREEV